MDVDVDLSATFERRIIRRSESAQVERELVPVWPEPAAWERPEAELYQA